MIIMAENGQRYELTLALDPADEREDLTVMTPAVLRTVLQKLFRILSRRPT